MDFWEILTIILIIFKLCGAGFSWLIAFSPLIVDLVIYIIIAVIAIHK